MSKPFIIDHTTDNDKLFDPVVDGERKGRGYDPSFIIPSVKAEMKALPSTIKPIPPSDYQGLWEEQEGKKSSLYHLKRTTMANGKPHPSLDQNGQGYCWAYSYAAGIMYSRASDNLPYVRLSPHSIACTIKNFRDQGGWCGLSARFARGQDPNHPDKSGCVPESHWPQKSMNRAYSTSEAWAEAKKFTTTEDYVDLTKNVYDQNMLKEQIFTCLWNNIPVIIDYNEWGHSVCGIRVRRLESGLFVPDIDNSWTPGWGENGIGSINARWDVDGAVAILVS